MWNSYFSYLDYLELRRRVEKGLAKPFWVLLHIVVYALFCTLMAKGPARFYVQHGYPFFLPPDQGNAMVLWSIALFLHGLWFYTRSGAWGNARNQAVDREIKVATGEDEILASMSSRSRFRLRALLAEHIRRRSGFSSILFVALLLNAISWILWMIDSGATNAYAWMMTPLYALGLIPIYLFYLWRAGRIDREIVREFGLVADDRSDAVPGKPKREAEHFSVHDTLLEVIEDDEKPKRAFRG